LQRQEVRVAVGTAAGLLDEQRTQSIFKHKILESYLRPFIAMTGSTAKHVVVVDGYAGRGKYPDGALGSGGLMLAAASRTADQDRQVTVVLIERDPTDFVSLSAVAAGFQKPGLSALARNGSVERYVDEIIAIGSGRPMFVLLDPCGAVLSWSAMSRLLAARRDPTLSTEVLINFSSHLNRRVGGRLVKGQLELAKDTTLDQVFGDVGWREAAKEAHAASTRPGFGALDTALAGRYADQVKATLGGTVHTFLIPVAKKFGNEPEYHLLFATRRTQGVWVFADAVARARKAWQETLGIKAESTEGDALFSTQDMFEVEMEGARAEITNNLRRMSASYPRFRLRDHTMEVFGTRFGSATEPAVTAAVRALLKSGELELVANAKHLRDRVYRRAIDPLLASQAAAKL
jgi:three-Cys-motif partner protein